MAVYSGFVIYTVFSKMTYIFASRCVSLKLQFQHLVKKKTSSVTNYCAEEASRMQSELPWMVH